MVNPEELRIGNYIRYEGTGYFLVRRIDRNDIEGVWIGDGVTTTENDPPEAFEPIPLTPEILEKAGFNKLVHKGANPDCTPYENVQHTLKYNDTEITIRFIEGKIYFNFTIGWDRWNRQYKEYALHQLQNLYFALTGEELEVSL